MKDFKTFQNLFLGANKQTGIIKYPANHRNFQKPYKTASRLPRPRTCHPRNPPPFGNSGRTERCDPTYQDYPTCRQEPKSVHMAAAHRDSQKEYEFVHQKRGASLTPTRLRQTLTECLAPGSFSTPGGDRSYKLWSVSEYGTPNQGLPRTDEVVDEDGDHANGFITADPVPNPVQHTRAKGRAPAQTHDASREAHYTRMSALRSPPGRSPLGLEHKHSSSRVFTDPRSVSPGSEDEYIDKSPTGDTRTRGDSVDDGHLPTTFYGNRKHDDVRDNKVAIKPILGTGTGFVKPFRNSSKGNSKKKIQHFPSKSVQKTKASDSVEKKMNEEITLADHANCEKITMASDAEKNDKDDDHNDTDHHTDEQTGAGWKCDKCGVTKTPLKRKGPKGPRTLCNACGVKMYYPQKKRHKSRNATGVADVASGMKRKRTHDDDDEEDEEDVDLLAEFIRRSVRKCCSEMRYVKA